jgi:transcriptional regulator with XRE-family HTH domain
LHQRGRTVNPGRRRTMNAYEMFGRFFKELRIKKGVTLRNFCQMHGLDAGNISKLERGLSAPPKSRELLEKYAEFLGLQKTSEEWYMFFDLAAACSGQIPLDVMSDAALVAKLPLIFRSLRGQDVSDEKLRSLAEMIRRS